MSTGLGRLKGVAELEARREEILADARGLESVVRVCIGTGCTAKGAHGVYDRFREAVAGVSGGNGKLIRVEAKCVGCHGYCERGPIVVIEPGSVLYQGVQESDVQEIMSETVLHGRIVSRLLYADPKTGTKAQTAEEIGFYASQKRIVLEQNGRIDPTSIDDYIGAGGYAALAKALGSMTPEEIIREVELSGLRGRGGAGFPTALKWRRCREAPGDEKYVVCNGDEGDPGAFMDRSVMEGNPHSVLEGMCIGAYAIGASRAFIYVRNEYPLAVEHLTRAITEARERGLLGADVLASGFSFDVRINRGAGAFICGEETSLIGSLEGRLPDPRTRPPYPAVAGYRGKPTNINNVETWTNIPPIILRGAAWFASIGTESSKGTKIFSLVGKIENTGLVEVPMGMSLRRIIEDIGGGPRGGKKLKAVQTGGPSGGCIPAEKLDAPVDYEELKRLGSMMGSGGLIVMDEDTCMVSVARYFFGFLQDESCGKCTACREGIAQARSILERITHGEGRGGDLELLETLAEILAEASLCGLGKTASNPLLSTLRSFREEYEEHITKRHCPARECRGLFRYEISVEACTGCGVCRKACPVKAISGEAKKTHVIDQAICTFCNTCFERCRYDAILKV